MDRVARFGAQFSGTRQSKREKIFEPATIECCGRTTRAHLLDLSLTGALGYSDTPPPVGATIVIQSAQQELRGSAVWVDGKHFGLSFDPALDQDAVARFFRHAVQR